MKKIILLTLISLSSFAADFTISLQGGGGTSGSFAKRLKGDGQIIGDLFLAGFQENIVIINGKKWAFNPSAGNVNASGKADFLASANFPCFYESGSCQGECLISPFDSTKTALTNLIVGVVPLEGNDYTGLLEITSNKTSGVLTINSCKEPYSGACVGDVTSCGSASTILNGIFQLKDGVEMKRAIFHDRNSYINKPSHDFRFKSIEYE